MDESVLIKKTYKDLAADLEFHDWVCLYPGVWRVSCGGKYLLLKTARDNTAESVNLLRREYGLASKLQHPFIINTVSFCENTPKGPAILMEYVEGRTLRDFIGENPSAATRRKILGQILDAVGYIHRKGMLHNDLKPGNIMVTDIGNDVKIIDFGFGESGGEYLSRRLGGTAGASAPEVLGGDLSSPSTGASDIYSIGGIIAFIFPHKYGGIVRKCHRERPEDRYRDVSSLRKAIAKRDRRPWITVSAAVLLLLSLAAFLPDLYERRSANEKDEVLRSEIRHIQEDLTVFFNETVDSITNPQLVPYREFARPVLENFVDRTFEYKDRMAAEMHPVCDSIYSRLVKRLMAEMSELPSFEELCDKGLMTAEEELWYLYLTRNGKSYEPYVAK